MCKKLLSISLLLLAATFHLYAQQRTPAEIPFTLTGQGHIMIKASVNGIEGNFIFDTGAGLNLLTKKFADKVGSVKKTEGFYVGHRATGEAIETDIFLIDHLKLGTTDIAGQKTAVLDVNFPLDGLISLMPFKDIPLTIDYTNKKLVLGNIPKDGKTIPLQISADRDITLGISTYVKLNDRLPVQISLDSGAGNGIFRFNARYIQTLNIDTANTTKRTIISDFDSTKTNNSYTTALDKISTLNGVSSASGVKGTFIEGLIYEGIGSINWLGNSITIDVPGKRMIVK